MTDEGRFAIRSVIAVAVAAVLLPITVGGGFLAGAALGCTADTIGGAAGSENDPCRDAGGAMVAGAGAGLVVCLVLLGLALRWSDRAVTGVQAAEVSPAASPKSSG